MGTSGGLRSIIGACALAVVCLLAPAALAATPSAGVTRIGPAPSGRQIDLVLPLTADVAGVQQLATAVNTPGSPQYGQFEPLSMLARRFGASPATRSRVVSFLHRAGATGVKIDATGMFADATMTTSSAQRLFGTSLSQFHSTRSGRYIAPNAPPRIPAALSGAVTGVVGLNTQPVFGSPHAVVAHGHFPHMPAKTAADNLVSGYSPRTGSPVGCAQGSSAGGFTPNQYLDAYGYSPLHNIGIDGQGERVALIEIDGFHYKDLVAFDKCFGFSPPEINGYGVGLSQPLAAGGESTLDLEVLNAAAPGLKEIDVYESRARAADVLRSLTAPLQNRGKSPEVVSASLGTCEPALVESIGYAGVRAVEGALATASASGISFLASSGDDGSTACIGRNGPIPAVAVSFPASSPFVTGVGGTNFRLNPDNSIAAQVVWNDGPDDLAAGGGGVSGLFQRPSYQNGFVSRNRRIVPDVAMLADVLPGYQIYCTAASECVDPTHPSPWVAVGGTSAAAPLFAGGLALADEVLRMRGRQELGVANGLLYTIAHSSASQSVFSDVTANDNDLGPYIGDHRPLGCCKAGIGFDFATGLGSPNLSQLIQVASLLQPKLASVGVSLPGQRPVAKKRLLIKLSCSRRCVVGALVEIKIGNAKPFKVESDAFIFPRKGHRTIKIALSAKDVRRIRGGLRSHKKVTATVFGVILDSGLNVETMSRGRTLRIRG